MSGSYRILGEPKHFLGSIYIENRAYPISFNASTNDLHELGLEFGPISIETGAASFNAITSPGKPGTKVDQYIITGTSEDGWCFYTDSFELRGVNAETARISGIAYNAVVFSPEHKSSKVGLERWLRGFSSWGGVVIETPLGKAGIESSVSDKDRQLVSARVAVTNEDISNPTVWGVEARKYLNYVHAGLSFIDGGWVAYPIERFSTPLGSFWRFFTASSSPREFPPEHALNNSEMLKAVYESYFKDPSPTEDFWDAVSWMYLPTTNNEGRFLGAMTAIEFWLSSEFDERKKFLHMSKNDFQPIYRELYSLITRMNVPESLKQDAETKLHDLRRLSLRQKILKAFQMQNISLEGISDDEIKRLVKSRNDLVHQGKWLESEGWELIYLARELITRIVLHTIAFEGTYESYLGDKGSHRRTFPQCERA